MDCIGVRSGCGHVSGDVQSKETDDGHDRQGRLRTSSVLQVVRIDRVHTQRYLGTKTLNPRKFSFQPEVLGFRFLSIVLDELEHMYFNIMYSPMVFCVEMSGNLVFHFLVPNQVEV